MTKDKKIQDYRDYIMTYEKIINSCIELLTALETHTGKLVDNRFFKKHFTINNEYRDWTKYSFAGKQYDFDTYNYRIYLGSGSSGEYINLQTRETSELVAALRARHESAFQMIQEYTAKVAELESFDEKALVNDLVAVYEKYGKPEIWGKVLDSYEVKYPNN